ncbi:uncharacterized protein LOC131929277 [Physella acuta]|uniref:uncharacterized protein LOC131929277 n=1 Tax=Physella acuta TaxID=109671 RepID=UPI0027DB3CEB|nr:uncharacterized protein LOC131929277 [Physella acuta]
MCRLYFISVYLLLAIHTVLVTEAKKKSKKNTEDDEWYDPCQAIWWRKIYASRKELPKYYFFENFVDCLRDYEGIYVNNGNFKTLGHGRDVPRGWWSRYRAHVREQKYPLELETYQEFEQHAEYLASAYTVYITESNFPMFWDERDIPEEWWTKFYKTHKLPFKDDNETKDNSEDKQGTEETTDDRPPDDDIEEIIVD